MFWGHSYDCYCADEKCTPLSHESVARWLASGVREMPTFNYVFIDRALSLNPDRSITERQQNA